MQYLHTKKKRNFTLNINFLKSPPRNFIFLEFQKGSVEWDYTKKYMLVHNFKTNKVSKKNFLSLIEMICLKNRIKK